MTRILDAFAYAGVLRPDPRRMVARLFVPGQELLLHGHSRLNPVLERILAMPGEVMAAALRLDAGPVRGPPPRSARSLPSTTSIWWLIDSAPRWTCPRQRGCSSARTSPMSTRWKRRRCSTRPSCPTRTSAVSPSARYASSSALRAVGEGHLSSIEFRTGVLDIEGHLRIDDAGRDLHLADAWTLRSRSSSPPCSDRCGQ